MSLTQHNSSSAGQNMLYREHARFVQWMTSRRPDNAKIDLNLRFTIYRHVTASPWTPMLDHLGKEGKGKRDVGYKSRV